MRQTSMIPGEEELKRLSEERSELRSKVKPLLDLVKGNAQFLVKYAPFCESVFFRSGHLKAAMSMTGIAVEQAFELAKSTRALSGAFERIGAIDLEIEMLKASIDEATGGEFRVTHPEYWDESTEQLDAKADEFLESNGLDAETAEPSLGDDDPFALGTEDLNPETAI